MDRKIIKQLIIGIIFILTIGGSSYGLVDYYFIIEPTCFDKVKNDQEEGIDCGLFACGVACEPAILPLNIVSQKLIEVKPNDYDFIAQINNPNSFFGASRVEYNLNANTVSGSIIKISGNFYIFPGQTRFVIVSNIRTGDTLADASIDIDKVDWEKIETFENINFPVRRKNYTVVSKNGVFSELEAVVFNNSDFDFDKVEVGVILFSDKGDIIAVNKTDLRTLISRAERHFKVSWPVELSPAARQDIEVLTNVFENSNFIKRYGTQEKFQKYY